MRCCSPSPQKVSSFSSSSCHLSSVFFHPPYCLLLASSHLFFLPLILFTSCRFCFFSVFAQFQIFSTPLTLHPLCFHLCPLPLPSSASRIDGLSAKFTSSVSCSARDTERWSRQFCFLSLLCVATCIAESTHSLTMWFLPSSLSHFNISLPLCAVVTTRPSLLKTFFHWAGS